jgi:hypothetical protein
MRLFLGSSKESVRLVRWASKFLKEELAVDPVPWESATAFPSGVGTLKALTDLVGQVDAAIIFVTSDDMAEVRGTTLPVPRDNIIFEAGLFLGGLGSQRTHLVVQRGVNLRLPSDWTGTTHEFFEATKEDPGITLKHTLQTIVDRVKKLGSRGTSTVIQALQQSDELGGINAAVGTFRRVLEEAVYPRVGKPDVKEVDAVIAYRFDDVANVIGPNLTRKAFSLRVCLSNMWDDQLAQIYLRKYNNRDSQHMKNAIKSALTVTLGKLGNWSEPSHEGGVPRFSPELPPAAGVEIYLTQQRVTHAYYRIDDLMCVVPLDMQTADKSRPRAWVFTRDQNEGTFAYYHTHFSNVIKESTRVYPG